MTAVRRVCAGVAPNRLFPVRKPEYTHEPVLHEIPKEESFRTFPDYRRENGKVYIRTVHFTPEQTKTGRNAHIRPELASVSSREESVEVSAEPSEKEIPFPTATIPSGGCITVNATAGFSDVKPWSPSDPNLHLLTARLYRNGMVFDDLIERVGFRQVTRMGRHLPVSPAIERAYRFPASHLDNFFMFPNYMYEIPLTIPV